jgi:hypothetical protein
MTFEQWWAENYDARLVTIPNYNPDDPAIRLLLVKVWNAALDASRPILFAKVAELIPYDPYRAPELQPAARKILDTTLECVDSLKVGA